MIEQLHRSGAVAQRLFGLLGSSLAGLGKSKSKSKLGFFSPTWTWTHLSKSK